MELLKLQNKDERELYLAELEAAMPALSTFGKQVHAGDYGAAIDLLQIHRPNAAPYPVFLSHPALMRFVRSIDDMETEVRRVEHDQVKAADDLMRRMSKLFGSEAELTRAFNTWSEEKYALNRVLANAGTGESQADASTASSSRTGLRGFFFKEDKLAGQGDAHMQVVAYFVQVLPKHHRDSRCPAVLVTQRATDLTIYIACLADKVCVDPVISMSLLHNRFRPLETLRLAVVVKALRTCLDELEAFYDNLQAASSPRPFYELRAYPYLTSVLQMPPNNESSSARVSFEYVQSRGNGASAPALLYLVKLQSASSDSRRLALLKLTPSYCIEAHMLMASAGWAPAVYGYEKVRLHRCAAPCCPYTV